MEDKLDKLEQNRSFTPAEAQETPEETPDPFVKLEARYQELDEKIQKYCSPEERARIRTAFEFARDSHQGQLRKDGSPYITHPLEVAHLVAELGLRCADPISLPFSSGITRPIAFAAPVLLGTILTAAARDLLRSPFLCGPSRVI